MMIDALMPYDKIGWDFDGTLIDHEKSELMHAFILAQPQKRHFIVTFRTHGLQRQIFPEMLGQYPDAPGPEHFADVLNIADAAWIRFRDTELRRKLHRLVGPLTPPETYYIEWKGQTCHRLQLPVMVDDLRDLVQPGCEKYGVAYLHPDEL